MYEQNYVEEIRQIWEMVKDSFRDTLPDTAIDLWFGTADILSYQNDTVTIGIPREIQFKTVNEKFKDPIQKAFSRLLGFEVDINLVFTGSATASSVIAPKEEEKPAAPLLSKSDFINYHFEYTFENFIVGSTNKFAHAACVAVANNPATNYNPLFIYGNSGLGKTHLLHATINRLKENNPNIKIVYTKGEDFTNQMIACLANKTMQEFHDKFRACDVLLIDDIQFIAGKNATQEEFFHTFNELHEAKKQIILTSDRPPRDIEKLEERLRSRFEWGLLADIEPPDLELRIAIIKKKAEQVNAKIPPDVLTFLGENLRSNIRQIEGALKKLAALSFLSGKTITLDLAKDCISELLEGAEPVSVTVDKIFTAVFHKYKVSKEDIIGKKRNKEIATARHIAIYLIRDLTEMSYPKIGKMFSDRDHATVISSYNSVSQKIVLDSMFAIEIDALKKEILD